jgi:hypothetical protein
MSRQKYEPWLEEVLQPDNPMPDWVFVIIIILILAGWAIASDADYQYEMAAECARGGAVYNPDTRLCVSATPEK